MSEERVKSGIKWKCFMKNTIEKAVESRRVSVPKKILEV